jgi:exonuclease SbcD
LELTSREFYQNQNTDDYLRITLTDEDDQPDAVGKLRVIYPNLMRLDYDNKRTRTESSVSSVADVSKYSPIELFEMLFEEQNGQAISETQRDFLNGLIGEVWEGEK